MSLIPLKALALVTLLAALSPAAQTQDAPPAPPVAPNAPAAATPRSADEATVQRGTLRQTYPVVGEFRAHLTSKLASQVSGRVVEVKADVGDRVKAGDRLVVLDPTFFNLDIAQQEAALKTAEQRIVTLEKSLATAKMDIGLAEVNRADAQLQVDRMKNLWNKPAGQEPSVPRKMVDDATTRAKQAEVAQAQAQARVEEAAARIVEATVAKAQVEAGLAYARQRLKETEIVAPFAATITERLVVPGDSVASAPATTLMELQDLDHLDLDFNVPQNFLAQVHEKTEVTYAVAGLPGSSTGIIERILPLGDEATRTYRCRVKVDNAARQLRPGLLVQVKLTLQERPGVLVAPAAALRATSTGWQVLLKKNGAFVPQAVEIGLRSEDEVEITQGLQPGDVVQLKRDR